MRKTPPPPEPKRATTRAATAPLTAGTPLTPAPTPPRATPVPKEEPEPKEAPPRATPVPVELPKATPVELPDPAEELRPLEIPRAQAIDE